MFLRLKRNRFLTILFIALAFAPIKTYAFSYVYIQGDKQVPFYVKLDGEMQPRYGKNYCIIPQLAPGTLQIEILFQQNEYPPEKFTIKVPTNGYRGFMLTRKDGVYALYDLQQRFYLPPGNDLDDDVMPTGKPVTQITRPAEPANTPKPIVKKIATTVTNNAKPVKKTATPEVANNTTSNADPRFIDNIELNNERSFQNEPGNKEIVSADTMAEPMAEPVAEEPVKNGVSNSDCPKPVSSSNYREILEKAKKKSDKNRLKYLLEETDKCYTTIQVRALTRSLSNDPERYTFLKQVYPRVTDQSNFPTLASLLTSKEWKEYFKLILP